MLLLLWPSFTCFASSSQMQGQKHACVDRERVEIMSHPKALVDVINNIVQLSVFVYLYT